MRKEVSNILSLTDMSNDIKELVKEIRTLNTHLDTFTKFSKTLEELTKEMKGMNENMGKLFIIFGELKGTD